MAEVMIDCVVRLPYLHTPSREAAYMSEQQIGLRLCCRCVYMAEQRKVQRPHRCSAVQSSANISSRVHNAFCIMRRRYNLICLACTARIAYPTAWRTFMTSVLVKFKEYIWLFSRVHNRVSSVGLTARFLILTV